MGVLRFVSCLGAASEVEWLLYWVGWDVEKLDRCCRRWVCAAQGCRGQRSGVLGVMMEPKSSMADGGHNRLGEDECYMISMIRA